MHFKVYPAKGLKTLEKFLGDTAPRLFNAAGRTLLSPLWPGVGGWGDVPGGGPAAPGSPDGAEPMGGGVSLLRPPLRFAASFAALCKTRVGLDGAGGGSRRVYLFI